MNLNGDFQNSVYPIDRAYPGGFAGGRFYPALGRIVDTVANVQVLFGNFAYYVANSQLITAAKQTGAHLAGLVLSSSQGISYDASVIYVGNAISGIAPSQTAEVAQRGSYYVLLQNILGQSSALKQFMPIYSRDTDGAAVVGVTTETGYTKTNFVVTDTTDKLVLQGLIRISNVENIEG